MFLAHSATKEAAPALPVLFRKAGHHRPRPRRPFSRSSRPSARPSARHLPARRRARHQRNAGSCSSPSAWVPLSVLVRAGVQSRLEPTKRELYETLIPPHPAHTHSCRLPNADILTFGDHMHRSHHYLASLFLTAALAAPISILAAPVPQESTIKTTRTITTGTTTRIAPGTGTSLKTTGILTNSPERTSGSSRSTGTGATLIPMIEIIATTIGTRK
jgi:hypothetical protein